MNVPIEHIRLSKQARDQLVKLKRYTGIEHWNVLCRWAFCISIAEPAPPPKVKIPADSSVEMNWRTFAGPHSEIMAALLKIRCVRDGWSLHPEQLAHAFRLHLHRGIGYLAANKSINNLCLLVETYTKEMHHE